MKDLILSVSFIVFIILLQLVFFKARIGMLRSTAYVFGILCLTGLSGYFFPGKKALHFCLAGLLVFELFYLMPKEHARKYDAFPKVPYIEFLKKKEPLMRSFGVAWTFFPNTGTGFGLDDLGIYEGMIVKRFTTYVRNFLKPNAFRENSFPALRNDLPDIESPFLDLLNVGFIIAPKGTVTTSNSRALSLVYSGEVNIYQRKNVFPRAFIAQQALFGDNQDEVIRLINENRANLRHVVVIEGNEDDMLMMPPQNNNSQVEIKEYTPNHVKMTANLESAGFLVLADTYYPGWKARIDGKKTKIYIADLMLRAVFVEKGIHEIDFYYRPFSFTIGAILSLLTLIFLITALTLQKFFKHY